MDALLHEVAERGINLPLAINPVQSFKCRAFDDEREMAFATRIVSRVADVLVALVFEREAGGAQCCGEPLDHLAGDRSGGSVRHQRYIEGFEERGTSGDTADQVARKGRRGQCPLLRARLPGAWRIPRASDPI